MNPTVECQKDIVAHFSGWDMKPQLIVTAQPSISPAARLGEHGRNRAGKTIRQARRKEEVLWTAGLQAWHGHYTHDHTVAYMHDHTVITVTRPAYNGAP